MKINKSLESLLLPIDKLVPLDGNPRRGNVDAIVASYSEFGQVKPIVVRPNKNGTFTVLAGNHQVKAAKELGWDMIAAVQMNEDDTTAVAFSLADNRTSDLGSTDSADLMAMIAMISDDHLDLIANLGWDEFEIAALEELSIVDFQEDRGYLPPSIVEPLPIEISSEQANEQTNIEIDPDKASTIGAAQVSVGQKSVVQYTLVFESAEQQRKWYDFIRFLRSSAVYGGETTASKVIEFIEAHADF